MGVVACGYVVQLGERGELRERLRHRRVVVVHPVHRRDAHLWDKSPTGYPSG
jgi:hypothetical protein